MDSLVISCSKCGGKGFIYVPDEHEGFRAKECECNKKRKAMARLRRSGLENVIKELTFDRYKATEDWQKEAYNKAKAYAENPKGWLYIGGQVGVGKTHLCTATCRELLLQGKEVRYFPWRDVTILKQQINDDRYSNELDSLKTSEVLYIDDLFKGGKENQKTGKIEPTPADVNIAFEILDYRYKNNLPTILSGERYLPELMDIDEGVGSRVYQMAKDSNSNIKRDSSRNWRTL